MVADIEVGVQTSADKIYIVRETVSDDDTITFRWNDRDWQIERDILRPCYIKKRSTHSRGPMRMR